MTFFYNLNQRLANITAVQQLNEDRRGGKKHMEFDRSENSNEDIMNVMRGLEAIQEADHTGRRLGEAPNEGNEFSGELAKAKATGAKEFRVDGKTYQVKEADAFPGTDDYKRRHGTDIESFRLRNAPSVMRDPAARKELSKMDSDLDRLKKMRRGELDPSDMGDEPPAGEKRGRGRPKGSKRAIGAKGPTGRSKLLRMAEGDNGVRDDLAYEIEQILDGAIEGTDQTDHIIDELGDLYDRIESSGDKVALKAYSMINGSIDQGTHAQVRAAQMALRRLKQGVSEDITALDESHFAVGDQVRCKKSGMTGEIIKMDKAHGDQDEKYYTFRRSDGKVIKKAPSELAAVANEGMPQALRKYVPGYAKREIDKKMDDEKFGRRDVDRDANFYRYKKIQDKLKKGVAEDYDRDEYDEEGEMAKSQSRTIEDAAEELQSILADDENLPEWVQKKITLALDYIDTARDYMKANRPENGMEESALQAHIGKKKYGAQGMKALQQAGRDGAGSDKMAKIRAQHDKLDEVDIAEKAVSKSQRAAAGIARAAQKGDIPRSKLQSASKAMADMPAKELRKFAKTKEKGLPDRVREGGAVDPNRHPQTRDYGRGKDNDLPFRADDTVSDRDEFGNPIKNVARHLARKGMRKAMDTKEKGLPEKVKEQDLDEVSKTKLGGYVRKAMDDEQQTRKQADAAGKSSKEAGKGFMKDRQDVLTRQADKRKTGIDRAITKLSKEDVDETTVSGSVATSDATPKANKGGMQFGKGIYDSMNREVEAMIAESMSINMSSSTEGGRSLTVTATDDDAMQLAAMLKMAGMGAMSHEQGEHSGCDAMEEAYGDVDATENQPDYPTNTEVSDDALQYSGGLNQPKSTGQTTVPVIASQAERQMAEDNHEVDEVHEVDEIVRMREMAGIREAAKPDFPDIDKDGDREESMLKAAQDKKQKEEKVDEAVENSLWNLYRRIG